MPASVQDYPPVRSGGTVGELPFWDPVKEISKAL
jgi:hypothetical protein